MNATLPCALAWSTYSLFTSNFIENYSNYFSWEHHHVNIFFSKIKAAKSNSVHNEVTGSLDGK
jgi:hypothetical protein